MVGHPATTVEVLAVRSFSEVRPKRTRTSSPCSVLSYKAPDDRGAAGAKPRRTWSGEAGGIPRVRPTPTAARSSYFLTGWTLGKALAKDRTLPDLDNPKRASACDTNGWSEIVVI